MSTNVDGPRACRPDELPQVIGLVDAAMRQGSDQTMLTDYPLVYAPDNLPNISVVVVDGRVVATAPVLPRVVRGEGYELRVGIISPTATAPAYQHRGFGAACVARCIERMETARMELSVLWTQVATFPFYELNGYQAVRPDLETLSLTGADADRFPAGGDDVQPLDVREAATLEQVRALHEAESHVVVRRAEDWPRLLALPKVRTIVVWQRGRVAAYLVDSRSSNKPGLIEAGGAPGAVQSLVHRALSDRAPDEVVPVPLSRTSNVLRSVVLDRAGAERPLAPGGHTMVRINDARTFWHAIGQRGEPPAIERRELASAVFGPHPERWVARPPAMARRFPIPLVIPQLDHS